MDSISEIKSRISIEQVVSQYVQLKKAGRHFKALCPFHKEKTPSFIVSPERQMAYCFGCRKGGDIFKFVQEMEGVDFRKALEMLADRAGVQLPKFSPEYKERASQRDRLIEMHEKAAQFFEKQLWDTAEGEKVLRYLKKRGLKEETVKKARLGFAAGSTGADTGDTLYKYLLEQDFTREEILAAGLAVARDTSQQACADRFRMRLIFPIKNLSGDICAFGGRAVKSDQEPKYLNSPETPIYHKNEILYGLSEARAAIRNEKCAIIVEGYMDALTTVQVGIANIVACSGTALTENQLRLLKRFTNEIILAFDLDNAGRIATERSIELALAEEFNIRVAVWDTEGKTKDPDECIRKDEKTFRASLKNAAPAMNYLFDYYIAQFGSAEVTGKRKIISALLPFFNKTMSPIELDEWMKSCAARVGVSHQSLYDELKQFQKKQAMGNFTPSFSAQTADDESVQKITPEVRAAEYLLGLILTYPETLGVANHIVKPEDFIEKELENIYRSLTSQYNQTLDDKEKERAEMLRMYAESRHADMQWDAVEEEVKQAANSLIKKRFDREKRSLVAKIKEAEAQDKIKFLEAYQELLSGEKMGD